MDQVSLVTRHVCRTFTLDVDDKTGLGGHGHDALVPDPEGEPDGVEARSDVGAAGRHPDADRRPFDQTDQIGHGLALEPERVGCGKGVQWHTCLLYTSDAADDLTRV